MTALTLSVTAWAFHVLISEITVHSAQFVYSAATELFSSNPPSEDISPASDSHQDEANRPELPHASEAEAAALIDAFKREVIPPIQEPQREDPFFWPDKVDPPQDNDTAPHGRIWQLALNS